MKQAGNSVEIELEATDPKDALDKAHKEADRIFNYSAGSPERPTVSVKPMKEKEE